MERNKLIELKYNLGMARAELLKQEALVERETAYLQICKYQVEEFETQLKQTGPEW